MSLHQHYLYDIAISYASEDRDYAEVLAKELRDRGVKVFYDNYEKSDMWGKNLYTHLLDVYRNKALYCVMFLSQHYANKQWTKHERESAQARAFSENEEYILPVRLDHTEIPGISPTIAYLSWPPETAETIADAIIAKMYDPYKDLFIDASKMLFERQISEILRLLEPLYFSLVSPLYRWRLAALRGQCYFERRLFVKAQGDLIYAVQEEPKHENLPADQKQERLLLHLHLAATNRELYQLEDALEQFQDALNMMNRDTPFNYVAEAHLGISLIALAQAKTMEPGQENQSTREAKLHTSLEHAENARFLYRSIGEMLHADSVACNIAEIEFALGHKEKTRQGLLELVDAWNPLAEPTQPNEQRRQKEQASIVSSASCLLAEIELTDEQYEQALAYGERALAAGESSYILKRADAYVMLGRIYGTIHNEEQAEQAFRNALHQLEKTERIGVRISIHVRFGSYLLSIGKIEAGQQQLEKARLLSDSVLYGRLQ